MYTDPAPFVTGEMCKSHRSLIIRPLRPVFIHRFLAVYGVVLSRNLFRDALPVWYAVAIDDQLGKPIMQQVRLFGLFLLSGIIAVLAQSPPSHGQVAPKGKAKGVAISADQIDLTKTGAISTYALVQRPAQLKGVRSWTWETKLHRWYPLSIAISPDSKTLASGGYDGIIHLWDIESGKHLRAFVGHNSYVGGLDFSADGAYLASAGMWDITARVWDLKTGQPIKIFREHKGYVSSVAWSPDGKRLAVCSDSSGQLVVWDMTSSKVWQKTEYGNPLTQIAWTKDSTKLAVSASKGGSYVVDAMTLKTIHTMKDTTAASNSVAFSSDDKTVIVGSNTEMLEYDVAEGQMKRKIMAPGYFAAYLPNGQVIGTTASGPSVFVVAGATVPAKTLPTVATHMKVTPDGKHLVTHNAGVVTLWDINDQPKQRTITVGEVYRPMWMANHPLVLGMTTSKSPTLWDTTTGKLVCTLDGHSGIVNAVGFPPSSKLIVTGGADKSVRVWESNTGKNLRTLEGHQQAVTTVAITTDGKVASGSLDKTVKIWPAKNDTPITLDGHTKAITALAWSKDGATLASGSADNAVILWTAAGKKIKALADHPAEVRSIAWSPTGDRVAIGGADDRVRIYQVATGKQIALQELLHSPPEVSAVAFSPDGNTVLAGRSAHTYQLWNAKATTKLPSFTEQAGSPVHAVGYSADGKTFATCTLDRCVRYWDNTGKVKAIAIAEKEHTVFLSADGHYRTVNEAEELLVAVVLTETGMQTLTPKEFATKYGFKNVPTNVKIGN